MSSVKKKKSRSYWAEVWRILVRNKGAMIGLAITVLLSCFSMVSFAVSGNIPADIIEMSSQVAVELEQEGICTS